MVSALTRSEEVKIRMWDGPKALRLVGLLPAALFSAASASGATISVTDSGDVLHSPGCATTGSGLCTLRDALTFANANPGPDVITFNIAGGGVHTIVAGSLLPPLTDPAGTTIDGYTQPGASANTLASADDAVLLIELRTSSALQVGLDVNSSSNLIRGLIIGGFAQGIHVTGGISASGNTIAGCFIGTDPTGTIADANDAGILIDDAVNTTIGGAGPADRNLLSGNQVVQLDLLGGTGARVLGNFIGLQRSGLAAIPTGVNTVGIGQEGQNTVIGGTTPAERNVIGGLDSAGISILLGCVDTSILGNWIGLNAIGTAAVGNGAGIRVAASACGTASIGGPQPGAGNVISGNGAGIELISSATAFIIQGNRIGTDPAGLTAIGNVQWGIAIELISSTVVVGGSAPGEGNLISGNGLGIWIENNTSGSLIRGNLIGTDASGSGALANSRAGILIEAAAVNNSVGGPAPADGNLIAFNGGPGVQVGSANFPINPGNTILSNSIHSNQGLGIDLTLTTPPDGVTPNDPGDADTGPNQLQNFPVLMTAIRSVSSPSLLILGNQDSNPASGANELQFFLADGDPSGHGEGQSLLLDLPGQPAGAFAFATPPFTPLVAVGPGSLITATATTTDGTSEFAGNIAVVVNQAPTADAGPSVTVATGTSVVLSGAQSSDTDGLPFGSGIRAGGFTWTQTSGAPVALANATSATPSFTAFQPGIYVFTLVVSDGLDSSVNTATVSVTAVGPGVAIPTLSPVSALLLAAGLLAAALWSLERR